MRQIQIIILLVLALNFCSAHDYSIESKHFDCLVETFSRLGVDLKKEMLGFEENLISKGVLFDYSGDSYYGLYATIEKTGDIDFTFNYSFLDSIKFHIDYIETSNFNSECLKLNEKLKTSEQYKASKIYLLKMAMDSIQSANDINVKSLASAILRILNPEDFEHDYYRMTALLMLATTQDIESGISRILPPLSDEEPIEKIGNRNLLLVYVSTDNDSVMLNDKKVSIDDISDIVKNYILSDSADLTMPELVPIYIDLIGDCYQSDLIISMRNDRETSYKTYITVQNQLIEAYKKAREIKSIEYFDLEFEKLDDEQKRAIKNLIPLRISES